MNQLSAPALYPSPSKTALHLHYVGKQLKDVQAPAAILDLAPIRRNCQAMLDTTRALGLKFRAHVKTHKTTELTEYQMGIRSMDVRLVASTVAEVEQLTPYLLECKAKGAAINAGVLYGLPIAASNIPRLAAVARILGPGSIGLFIDHPEQVSHLSHLDESIWPGTVPVFVKIASPVPRAGIAPGSSSIGPLVQAITNEHKVRVAGAYSHLGQSYASGSPSQALQYLIQEIKDVTAGADQIVQALPPGKTEDRLIVSLGATPTATAAQNALADTEWNQNFRTYIDQVKQNYDVELHAGVYPVLDMQQLATRARLASDDGKPVLSMDNLALRIMVEVASVYEEREKPEALIGAGSIVLGREPCKSYPGWGVITPWKDDGSSSELSTVFDPDGLQTGWIVGRISQEHGNLTWEGSQDGMRKLNVSEKIMIWPNHACMAGPSFGWYLVVDSESSEPDIIQDVWVRWRGW